MGDAEYGGEDFGDFFDDDLWLYIEDDVAFADELAETQIPSPGYAGTNAELMLETYEYDTYEYFGDLEYGGDDYWDITLAARRQAEKKAQAGSQSPRKRKRASTTPRTEKRRRLDGQHSDENVGYQNVVYRQAKSATPVPVLTRDTSVFALFPDWRERFPLSEEPVWQDNMPEDMKRAAEGSDGAMDLEKRDIDMQQDQLASELEQDTTRHKKKHKATRVQDEHEETSQQEMLSLLDPEALRAILKSNLGDTGINEEAFMSAIGNMLSEGGSADDAAAQLASMLLDQDGESNEAALGWLQGRGVNMEAADDEDALRVDSGAGLNNESTQSRLKSNSGNANEPSDQSPAASSRKAARKDTRTKHTRSKR